MHCGHTASPLCCIYILCKKFSDKMFDVLHHIVMCVYRGVHETGVTCIVFVIIVVIVIIIIIIIAVVVFAVAFAGAAVAVVDVRVKLMLIVVIVLYIICRLFQNFYFLLQLLILWFFD